MNQKWPKSDFFGLKLILSIFNENLKSIRSNQLKHCFQVRNSILMYFWPENFQYISIFRSLNQKWPNSDFFGLKLILSTFNENLKKYSLESVEIFVCKSEIAFWRTFDQTISNTFQYFNVWIKSGLNVTFSA